MDSAAINKRRYRNCGVFGCLHTTINSTDLTFFSLPVCDKRRSEWLKLMLREDLEGKPAQGIWVCEDHFDPTSILISEKRKTLKKNSIPKLKLPGRSFDDKECQATPTTIESFTNCYVHTASKGSQTAHYLLKKQIKAEIREFKIKLKRLKTIAAEKESSTFFNICDKFLSKKLADAVKEHVQNKHFADNT